MTDVLGGVERIKQCPEFDAIWYAKRYRDVEMLEMDPAYHFIRYGGHLLRSPGPNFDTKFYLKTYANINESVNPLVDYLSREDKDQLPTSQRDLKTRMDALEVETQVAFDGAAVGNAERPDISYCIPVMGRLEDLQGTLQFNLEENLSFRGKIEFLVIEFGEDREVEDWIKGRFASYLDDGYLRILNDTHSLDTWHFGKAKNAFRPHLKGRIYSSLDGDNFVTAAETRQLLEVASEHPFGFVFHHFSGNWGDGSSGRVSMPTSVYRCVGYDPKLLPRQFDEMDLMRGALKRFPALPFIGINPNENAFTKSVFMRDFFEQEKLPNRRIYLNAYLAKPPLSPRGSDYTEVDTLLKYMNNYNSMVSAFNHSKNDEFKEKYIPDITKYKNLLIETIEKENVIDLLFESTGAECVPDVQKKDLCLFACTKNEELFLKKFVQHYRALGVTKFFFVDDGSTRPLKELDLGPEVYCFRPKVGDFRTAKTLWIEGLIKALVPVGNWVITVDADEFIQVPKPFKTLPGVIRKLLADGRDFAPGVLLDLMPSPSLDQKTPVNGAVPFDEFLGFVCRNTSAVGENYEGHRSIQWGFGPYADLSWRVDARFHAFGTFDSLRKLSLFRYKEKRHLNQGFHTFHHTDSRPSPGQEIWEIKPILPIFHYKMIKLFSDEMRQTMVQESKGYHARTQKNLNQIFGGEGENAEAQVRLIADHLVPCDEAIKKNFFDEREETH